MSQPLPEPEPSLEANASEICPSAFSAESCSAVFLEPLSEALVMAASGLETSPPTNPPLPVSNTGEPKASVARSKSSKRPAHKSIPQPNTKQNSSGVMTVLRSRRVRALVTCACVLMIAGLLVMNLKGRSTSEVAETPIDEIEMSEFGSGSQPASDSLDGNGNHSAAPGFDDRMTDASGGVRQAGAWSENAPPANPWDHRPATNVTSIPTNRFESKSDIPRGAWLTGQIELDVNAVTPASFSSTPANNQALRTSTISGDFRLPRQR